MIRQDKTRSREATSGEALREIREQLRAYEDSQLAEVADTLARTTESIERSLERLDTLEHDILTPERAAIALGYEKENEETGEREPMVEAFEKMSAKNGWPRRKLSARRFVYLRRELIEAIERMES